MSPIPVTIIPSNFGFFCHQFWRFDEIGEFLVTKISPILVKIIPSNFVFFVTNFGENFRESPKLVTIL